MTADAPDLQMADLFQRAYDTIPNDEQLVAIAGHGWSKAPTDGDRRVYGLREVAALARAGTFAQILDHAAKHPDNDWGWLHQMIDGTYDEANRADV